jgi:hypothetical protein
MKLAQRLLLGEVSAARASDAEDLVGDAVAEGGADEGGVEGVGGVEGLYS